MTQRPTVAPDLSALSRLAPEVAETFAKTGSDVALVIDEDGVIRTVAGGQSWANGVQHWVGQHWADTVTGETRPKIQQLLEEVSIAGVARRREVNLPSPEAGTTIPVTYAAVRLGRNGPVLAVGRDLRAVAAIQQRFVKSQQEMEQQYWKLRQVESRYRLLFEAATDAVLVADAQSLLVIEANEAAARLFGQAASAFIGRAPSAAIDVSSRVALDEMLLSVRASGRPVEIRARLASGRGTIEVSATPVSGESSTLILLRARPAEAGQVFPDRGSFASLVEQSPDSVVIVDGGGRVLAANGAFAHMCRLADGGDARGRALGDWLVGGEPAVSALLEKVRHHGIVAHHAGAMAGSAAGTFEVDVSATLLTEGDQECIGLTLRRRRPEPLRAEAEADEEASAELTEAMLRLASQLGSRSLPLLVRDAAEAVERHLIREALQRSGGDHEAASALLGIAPHSLVMRLDQASLRDANGAARQAPGGSAGGGGMGDPRP